MSEVWTQEELNTLKSYYNQKVDLSVIEQTLKKPFTSICEKIKMFEGENKKRKSIDESNNNKGKSIDESNNDFIEGEWSNDETWLLRKYHNKNKFKIDIISGLMNRSENDIVQELQRINNKKKVKKNDSQSNFDVLTQKETLTEKTTNNHELPKHNLLKNIGNNVTVQNDIVMQIFETKDLNNINNTNNEKVIEKNNIINTNNEKVTKLNSVTQHNINHTNNNKVIEQHNINHANNGKVTKLNSVTQHNINHTNNNKVIEYHNIDSSNNILNIMANLQYDRTIPINIEKTKPTIIHKTKPINGYYLQEFRKLHNTSNNEFPNYNIPINCVANNNIPNNNVLNNNIPNNNIFNNIPNNNVLNNNILNNNIPNHNVLNNNIFNHNVLNNIIPNHNVLNNNIPNHNVLNNNFFNHNIPTNNNTFYNNQTFNINEKQHEINFMMETIMNRLAIERRNQTIFNQDVHKRISSIEHKINLIWSKLENKSNS